MVVRKKSQKRWLLPALALVIASSVLKVDAMAIPGALYGVLMYAGGLLFALTMRRHIQTDQA